MIKYAFLVQQLRYGFCQASTLMPEDYNTLRDRLLRFPYSRLNEKAYNKTVSSETSDFLAKVLLPHTVAYSALKQFSPSTLKQAYQYLFGSEMQGYISGSEIFTKYFNSQEEAIIDVLNKSNNEEELTYYLRILFYLQRYENIQSYIDQIDFKRIEEKGTLVQKSYLLSLYENRPNFLSFSQKFYNAFQSASVEQKRKAALVIISIPGFQDKISSTIAKQCLKILTEGVKQMDEWTVFRTLENIFETNYPETIGLVNAITDNIFNKLSEQNGQTMIPILHKMIKLRDKLKMSNDKLSAYIGENPRRFNSIFFKRKVNKQAFLETIASKDSQRFLPEEIKIQFVNYVLKMFREFAQADTVDSDEMIETVKLAMKFYFNFRSQEIGTIGRLLEDKLVPMYEHEMEVVFWLVTFLIRIDKQYLEKPKIRETTLKLIAHYSNQYKSSTQPFHKHVNLQKITQLHYHLARCNLPLSPKNLLEYDYKHIRTFQQVIYACYTLNKVELSPGDKFSIFNRMVPRIEALMKEGKFRSVKQIFVVLTALHASKCEESKNLANLKYLYADIEQAIMKSLQRARNGLTHSQLLFIKRVFSENRSNYTNPQPQGQDKPTPHHQHNKEFMTFIDSCIKAPQGFQNHVAEYFSNERISKIYGKDRGVSGSRGYGKK